MNKFTFNQSLKLLAYYLVLSNRLNDRFLNKNYIYTYIYIYIFFSIERRWQSIKYMATLNKNWFSSNEKLYIPTYVYILYFVREEQGKRSCNNIISSISLHSIHLRSISRTYISRQRCDATNAILQNTSENVTITLLFR